MTNWTIKIYSGDGVLRQERSCAADRETAQYFANHVLPSFYADVVSVANGVIGESEDGKPIRWKWNKDAADGYFV